MGRARMPCTIPGDFDSIVITMHPVFQPLCNPVLATDGALFTQAVIQAARPMRLFIHRLEMRRTSESGRGVRFNVGCHTRKPHFNN
jgi:hypothetical protein